MMMNNMNMHGVPMVQPMGQGGGPVPNPMQMQQGMPVGVPIPGMMQQPSPQQLQQPMPPQPPQPVEKLDNISKVKTLIGPLRESLTVSDIYILSFCNLCYNFVFEIEKKINFRCIIF